jgi:hypothetical protein
LDLTVLANDLFSGIEKVDLTGTGNNTMILDANEILDFSTSSLQLLITGNAGDTVEAGPADAWMLNSNSSVTVNGSSHATGANGQASIDGGTYVAYSSADNLESLLVKTDITLNFT